MKETRNSGRFFMGAWALVLIFMASVVTAAPPPRGENRQRMLEKIETIKMWKIMDALSLDSQTALKVFPIIKEMDQKRIQLREKERGILQQIKQMAETSQADKKIDALASKLFELKSKISNVSREEYQKLKSILTEKQLAQFLLFQQTFRRGLIQRWMMERRGPAWKARGKRRGPRPMAYQGQK